MSTLADVFAAVRLQLDGTGFEAQAVAMADKAGKNVGDKMADEISNKLKTKVKAAIGATIGAGVGIALSGANQLDAATRRLQADTGMTADEAKAAEKALAGMYRNNLQGFDEIGEAMARVHNDLQLVGPEADKVTASILKFSTATGQNAAEAVERLDDIMDNWSLSADQMESVMDRLIVSHQLFGGNIADNETTLAKLAPAMRAANFEIDDGIALLGLFGAKGLNSERAAAAFSKALTKVESPEELKALILDIQNTLDPFERAQKAADLFGAKAGAQLANALGGVNLDDYVVTVDEAAGATTKAAAAITSGFGAQFQLLLKNVGGALAEFGTNFGPLVMLASVVGPRTFSMLTAGIGGVMGALLKAGPLTRVTALAGGALGAVYAEAWLRTAYAIDGIKAAITKAATSGPLLKASTFMGTSMGKAAGVAMKLAFVVGMAAIASEVAPIVNQAGRDLHDQIFQGPLEGIGDALEEVGKAHATWEWPLGPKNAPDWARLTDEVAGGTGEISDTVERMGDDWKREIGGLDGVTDDLAGSTGDLAGALDDTEGALDDADDEARDLRSTYVKLAEAIGGVDSALEGIGDELYGTAILAGDLAEAQQRLNEKIKEGPDSKSAADVAIYRGEIAELRLDVMKLQGQQAQAAGPQAFYDWLVKQAGATDKADAKVLRYIERLKLLQMVLGAGFRTPDVFTTGGRTGLTPRAMGGPVIAGQAYWVGERRPEVFVPETNGRIIAEPVAASGGNNYSTTLVLEGRRPDDPFELFEMAERYTRWGILYPAVEP